MGTRNHYFVLGVDPRETAQGIRSAFRDLAKRFHPDRVGSAGTSQFQAIHEAYRVLADSERRRKHDDALEAAHESQSRRDPSRDDDRQRSNLAEVEPLIPNVSMRRDLGQMNPSVDAMLERIHRNFSGMNVPKGEGLDELNVAVGVSSDQAARGARFRLGVPVFARCPSCAGHGRSLFSHCSWCAGQGLVESERVVAVDLPPMMARDTTFVMPLSGLGIRNFYLRLHVHVEPHLEPRA